MSVLNKIADTTRAGIVTLLLLTGTAVAQSEGTLQVTTTVQKVVVVQEDDGSTRTEYVAADTVVPGERVIYTISFRNIGDEPADDVVITNPIAESLTYVAGSAAAAGLDVEFSIDGGQTFAAASELRVSDAGIDRPATTEDYTHVRWVMQTELGVGDEGQASFAADLK